MIVLSGNSPNCSTIRFRIVDFPALVYPTTATCGMRDCCLFFRCTSLVRPTSSSSFFQFCDTMLDLTPVQFQLFLTGAFITHAATGARPVCSVHHTFLPVSAAYIASLAVSTCNFASLVWARMANISRIRLVRSMIGSSSSFPRFLTCEGVRELSNTISCARILLPACAPLSLFRCRYITLY